MQAKPERQKGKHELCTTGALADKTITIWVWWLYRKTLLNGGFWAHPQGALQFFANQRLPLPARICQSLTFLLLKPLQQMVSEEMTLWEKGCVSHSPPQGLQVNRGHAIHRPPLLLCCHLKRVRICLGGERWRAKLHLLAFWSLQFAFVYLPNMPLVWENSGLKERDSETLV